MALYTIDRPAGYLRLTADYSSDSVKALELEYAQKVKLLVRKPGEFLNDIG